jgi:hypothetical protein
MPKARSPFYAMKVQCEEQCKNRAQLPGKFPKTSKALPQILSGDGFLIAGYLL